jgi:hypothetical protein
MKASAATCLLLAALTPLAAADAAKSAPIEVSVGGTNYLVDYFQNGSFSDNLSRFTTAEMPWLGNASLAEQFATAVGSQLGLPIFGTMGPAFAFEITSQAEVYVYASNNSPPGVVKSSYGDFFTDAAFATGRTVPPASVPAPLPLFGAAAAFGASRHLRRRIKLSV